MRGQGRVFKRGTCYWIAYCNRGKEFRESSKSPKEGDARRLLKERLRQIQSGRFVGPEQERILLTELLDAVVTDYEVNKKRSKRDVEYKLKHVRAAFAFDRATDVTATRVEGYKQARLKEGAAPGTVNRELSLMRRAFRLAIKRDVLSSMPTIELLEEGNAREGFVERADFEAVVSHLQPMAADYARFAYLAGWRLREVGSLRWADVDLAGGMIRLRREASKTKKGRLVAIEGDIQEIIQRRLKARQTRHADGTVSVAEHVFHRKGKQARSIREAWESAREKAGMPGLLFHDLRRSAVRNMVRAGVPETVVMRISGHKTRSVFDRYNITSERDIRDAMRKTQTYLDSQPSPPSMLDPPPANGEASAG